MQARHAASPYLALWNRITAFDPADLDAAFADRKIVKATLLRIALHAVHAGDHPHLHEWCPAGRSAGRGAARADSRPCSAGGRSSFKALTWADSLLKGSSRGRGRRAPPSGARPWWASEARSIKTV
ncbi:DNA glycosylase AlkZ-like family protein [Streptosporangium pseudovulgare]|uniref:DNA glycosylase AlkZ-like family protein n=1 Tax=Streptosporangium pseudovulgare TaxID=35765 RepID=UPI003570D668